LSTPFGVCLLGVVGVVGNKNNIVQCAICATRVLFSIVFMFHAVTLYQLRGAVSKVERGGAVEGRAG